MTAAPAPSIHASVAHACTVCGAPLTLLDAPTSPTCGRQACRWTYQSAPSEARCTICGRLLPPERRAERVCASAACRTTHLDVVVAEGGRQAERRQRAQEELEERAAALRAESAAPLGVADAAADPIVITPSFCDSFALRRLPRRRQRALRAHVAGLVDAALAARERRATDATVATAEPAEPAELALDAVLGAACTSCRGFCCHRGGDEAYLTVATVARWMDAHPELGRDAVVDAYARRAGGSTYEESCVFHRGTGCALPREMRSDTCNDFFCGPLVDFQRAVGRGGPPRAFFAATIDGRIESAVFVDVRELRVARRRGAPVADTAPAADA